MAKLDYLGGQWEDLGETKSIVLSDDWVESQLPYGWRIEQTGYWYVAFLGEEWHSQPYTSLTRAVEMAWTRHNGTGQPYRHVAEKFYQVRSINEVVKQMSIDDLL
jgi:hypothetical protein